MRRSNLLFFGIQDDPSDTWSSAENKLLEICSEHLGITIDPARIERAHHLGKYGTGKCRPIIAKFTFFKDKQQILEKGHKLKGTPFAVREDFSAQTRLARKKLLAFAKTKNTQFRLNVDKLRIDNCTYVYDDTTDSIKQYTE